MSNIRMTPELLLLLRDQAIFQQRMMQAGPGINLNCRCTIIPMRNGERINYPAASEQTIEGEIVGRR